MKTYLRYLLFGAALSGMGFAMPSCPGQGNIQQEMDMMKTENQNLLKQLKALQNQVTSLNSDMGQVKQLLPQMTNVIQAQKGAIDQLTASVNQMKGHGGGGAHFGKKR